MEAQGNKGRRRREGRDNWECREEREWEEGSPGREGEHSDNDTAPLAISEVSLSTYGCFPHGPSQTPPLPLQPRVLQVLV